MLIAAMEKNSIRPLTVSQEDIELYLEIIKRSSLYIVELTNEISNRDNQIPVAYSTHEIQDGINAMAEAIPMPLRL
jgi:hypothetical protein